MMAAVALPADLQGDRAAALLPQLRQQIQSASSGAVVLDAGGVQRFDSATLALLLECRRLAQRHQRSLEVQQLPPGLQSMAHVYGVDSLLGLSSTVQAGDLA